MSWLFWAVGIHLGNGNYTKNWYGINTTNIQQMKRSAWQSESGASPYELCGSCLILPASVKGAACSIIEDIWNWWQHTHWVSFLWIWNTSNEVDVCRKKPCGSEEFAPETTWVLCTHSAPILNCGWDPFPTQCAHDYFGVCWAAAWHISVFPF